MIARVSSLVLSLVAAGAVEAAPILVRSAEHDGFTRVVVDFARRPDWSLDRDDNIVRLNETEDLDFDLSNIYRRIRRDRIERVWQEPDGRLAIALGCDCVIDTFELPNQGLVLDIRQAGPLQARNVDGLPSDWTILPYKAPEVLPGLLTAATDPESDEAVRRQRVDEARVEIGRMLARGAAQGMVKSVDPILPENRSVPVESEPEDDGDLVASTIEDDIQSPYPNLRIETQIDRDSSGARKADRAAACLEPAVSEIEAWGSPELIESGLRFDRVNLTNEAGADDAEAYAALAREYLYLSFGAEAAGLLRDGPEDLPNRDLLIELARIMDGPAPAPLLRSQSACDSTAAVLALLAEGAAKPRDLSPILARFAAYPKHMREHLGPRLAAVLLDMGDPESASIVRNAIDRAAGQRSAERAMLEAKIDLKAGRPDAATDQLFDIVRKRAPDAAEALRIMMENGLEADAPVSRAIVDQALALSFEADGPSAERLRIAAARTLGQRGDFDAAFGILPSVPEEGRRAATNEIFGQILATEDDPAFLRDAVRFAAHPMPDSSIRVAIAARLLDEQLIEPARAYLETGDAIPTRPERLLRARIALLGDEPRIAESYLAGLDGEEVEDLQSRIAELDAAAGTGTPEGPAEVAEAPVEPGLAERNREMIAKSAALREEFSELFDR